MTGPADQAWVPAGSVERPFWDALADGELRLPQCVACGRWQWPASWRCGSCGSWEQRWVRVEPHGRVYSWTRTWYPFVPERADDLPYVVVLAELEQAGGSRVLGLFTGNADSVAIGEPVTGVFLPPDDRSHGMPSIAWRLDSRAGEP